MTKRITPGQIKKNNRKLMYDYIYRKKRVSQQEIAYALRLSRQTVATNLAEMEEAGLVFKDGQLDSDQTGRKAMAYSIAPDYRIAIGVELMRKVVKIIAVNLYGEKIDRMVLDIHFEQEDSYYQKVSDAIQRFIASHSFRDEQILGIGFAMQGLVSVDGSTVTYGVILNCTGVTTDVFSRYLQYPCTFVHDPDAAAMSELWVSPELRDAVYLSLSRHLGGALISDRQISAGKHGHNATFEHIQVKPKGALCYCGKRGCMETLCSMKALLGDEDPEVFFDAVRSGAEEPSKRWQTYLHYLGRMIGSLHLIHDVDFILGGHLAPYLTQEDIQYIYKEIRQLAPFQEPDDFLLISKMPSHNITIGAALPYVRAFLEEIGGGDNP